MRAWIVLLFVASSCGSPGSEGTASPGDDLDLEERERGAVPRDERRLPSLGTYEVPASASGRTQVERRVRIQERGGTIDLDVKNADVHNVLRLLADVGGINIVIADSVRGAVTLRLRRVHWRQAFNAVLASQKLGSRDNDGILFVSPPLRGSSP